MVSGRRLFVSCLTVLASASFICAEDSASSTPKRFDGKVTANSVFVRSRASEDAYPTMMLKKDQTVTVVDIKGQWLKIVPPAGSFAYIPKSFVLMRGDGTVGRMKRDWIAHVGSSLNELATEPMATVHTDEDVQIIGQHNEYFEIKPPADSYLWVNKQFVEPIAPSPEVAAKPTDEKPAAPASPDSKEKVVENASTTETPDASKMPATPKKEVAAANPPSTQPATETEVASAPPATQPAFDALAEYDRLEQQYTDAASKPILQQPLPDLIAGYNKVLASDDLPSSMRQIASIRVASLKMRNDAREQFLKVQSDEKKMSEKQQSLVAERGEIEDRIKQNNLDIYAAVGTLRTSSLQVGNATLYRLTDPNSGRTVAYLRTNDAKFGNYLGQFVGVRGPIVSDAQLKSIIDNPTDIKPVDQSKVNQSIAAQIVPPSLVRTGALPSNVNFANKETKQPADDGEARIDKEQPQPQ